MDWITAIWCSIAAACLTLASLHLLIWLRQRGAWAHLAFSFSAASAAGIAVFELAMMRSQTPEQFGKYLRLIHFPIFTLTASLVCFVLLYLRAGRKWLAWAAVGARGLALILNLWFAPNLNYVRITGLHDLVLAGGARVSIADGQVSQRAVVGQLSSLLLLAFLLDAMRTVWRRGDRIRSIMLCGSMVLFILVAAGHVVLIQHRVIDIPYVISIAYLGVILAMGYELSSDVIQAGSLAQQLRVNQNALRASENRLDLAAAAAGLAMWRWDMPSDEIWLSEQGGSLFGIHGSKPTRINELLQFVHADDRQLMLHAIANSMNGDGDYRCEFRVLSNGHPTRWIAGRGRVEFDGAGKPLCMSGACIDITQRKLAEQALRESEARFREVADTAPAMIWMTGTDKSCTFVNKGWLDFTGRRLEQELGNGWAQGLHSEDSQASVDAYVSAFDARREFAIEYRLRSASGEYRWVLGNGVPRFDADGEFVGYIGTSIDITEQKLANERFRQVVEAAPNAMIMVNAAGEIALVNAQAEVVFGYAREELVGRKLDLLLPEPLRGGQLESSPDALRTPLTRTTGPDVERFGERKDGSRVPVEIAVSPVSTSQGTFVLASVIDISERRQAEADAAQQRNELAHLSRVAMLGELSGSLAHELNQPLTAILSNAEAAQKFLMRDPVDLQEIGEILKDIVQDDNRAGEIIRRLRLLLKKGELQRHEVDVNETIQEVLKLVHSDLLSHDVSVQTELQDGLPIISADRVQVQQVLLNLVVNACDAMSESDRSDRRLVVRSAAMEGTDVEICVADRGSGIAPDHLDQIFTPFFTTKSQGMGLGLTVCRTIVSAHGGKLWATNNSDRGACFHLELPRAAAGTMA